MISKKSNIIVLTLLIVMIIMVGCQNNTTSTTESNSEVVVIKAGHSVSQTDPYHIGLEKMAELVDEGTEGRYKIEIYPSGQIGGERDLIEGTRLGSVGMCVVSVGPLSNFAPELAAVQLPGLISTYEQVDAVFLGEIGEELTAEISKKANVKGFGFWENGFTSVANTKRPINSVEDFQGLKIRTMEDKIHQAAIRALGADPVPMAWGEAFTAVQQGAVDGVVQGISLIYSLKVGEICDYVAETNHIYAPAFMMMNQGVWEKMSPEDQKVFESAAKEANVIAREENRKQCDEAVGKLEAQGVEVTHPDPVDLTNALAEVQKEILGDEFSDLVERIKAVAQEN